MDRTDASLERKQAAMSPDQEKWQLWCEEHGIDQDKGPSARVVFWVAGVVLLWLGVAIIADVLR
jgi:hypothetical protein